MATAIESGAHETSDGAGSCPFRGAASAPIDPAQLLFVPHRKRLSHAYVVNDAGDRELQVDYGLKTITFDDERFFAFGEQVATQAAFAAGDAMSWGTGYAWDEIAPLLQALVDDGILQRGAPADEPRNGGLVPSLIPPATCTSPRFWSLAECEAITQDLAGRAVEAGYLEAFIPVFRVAHVALDGDGRQVGEANVFPPALRLDRDTEWRICQYPGSRYHDEMPMNITALKAMIKHWKPIMAVVQAFRAEMSLRLAIGEAGWTIGDLHVLACAILGLPAYALVKGGGASPQVPLHPVLSSLFRITDGVRMTTEDMMFTIAHARSGAEPMTAAGLHAHAEHFGVLINTTGVCAGPKHLIDEFLAVLIDGAPVAGNAGSLTEIPDEVTALLREMPAAIDYAMYALAVYAVSLPVWIAMSRAYQALIAICEPAASAGAGPGGDRCPALLARLRTDWLRFERLQITIDRERDIHMHGYVDHYARARRALRTPLGAQTLEAEIALPPVTPAQSAAADQLGAALHARLGGASAVDIPRMVDALTQYLREEQAVLAATSRFQDAVNAVLTRPRPQRPLSIRDLHVNYLLRGSGPGFPYLFQTLELELGIRVACTATAIQITDLAAG